MSLELINIGSPNSCGSNPCCGSCTVEVQRIQCFLPHRGYGKFNCDGTAIDFEKSDGTEENPVKYLTYKTRGPAIIGGTCGGAATNKKDVTQTWTIDPYYGGVGGNNFTCYNGDEGVFSLCDTSIAEVTSCSNTERVYSCGQATSQEKINYCDEEDFEKTWTESVENSYSLDDVAQNVDSALSFFGFSNPKGTKGVVEFGTDGNKVLRWSADASRTVYGKYERGVGGVYKEKSRIKFLQELTVTIITELDTGSVSTQEITFEKGQVYNLEPPNTPGRTYFEVPSSSCFIGTGASTSCSGNITTKTKNNNNCTYFTGPDCELYNTRIETINGNYSQTSDGFLGSTCEICNGSDNEPYPAAGSRTESFAITHQYKACPSTDSCEGSKNINIYSNTIDSTTTAGDTLIYNCIDCDNCSTTFNGSPTSPPPIFILPSIYKNCDETTSQPIYRNSLSDYVLYSRVINFTKTITQNSVTQINTIQDWDYVDNDPDHGGPSEPTDIINAEGGGSITLSTVWSNTELDSDDPNVETETCILGDEGCTSCNNCSSWYITHNFESKQTATVSVQASFTAPEVEEGEDPKNYRTYVQTIVRKDDTSNSKCANIILTSTTQVYENSSSGGEIIIEAGTIPLPVEEDTSNCLIYVSAITFEVKPNE
jgi:hypothetical protein